MAGTDFAAAEEPWVGFLDYPLTDKLVGPLASFLNLKKRLGEQASRVDIARRFGKKNIRVVHDAQTLVIERRCIFGNEGRMLRDEPDGTPQPDPDEYVLGHRACTRDSLEVHTSLGLYSEIDWHHVTV